MSIKITNLLDSSKVPQKLLKIVGGFYIYFGTPLECYSGFYY
jgi:hypothetical protein